MRDISKGAKVELSGSTYTVQVTSPGSAAGAVDLMAVLLASDGKVRTDADFVFFNSPRAPGVTLTGQDSIHVDLAAVPADVDRVLIGASTEAQGKQFGDVPHIGFRISSTADDFTFAPAALSTETVLQGVSLYRRDGRWRLNAIGQGYAEGLAAFAKDFGIVVDDEVPAAAPISLQKVSIRLTKDSPNKIAKIDLRKSQGDPNWVLTVGLEWDGRDAQYDGQGRVTRYGTGDLDVYFFCRNEETNDYVVISGEDRHRGSLQTWPFIHHYGDSQGPGSGNKPAVEQVRVLPNENGDLLVNIYQSVDNGTGAIDTFGQPRCVIRYGRAGADGLPGTDADEIVAVVGNSKDSYWATVAHIDVQDGVLTVDGETRYSRPSNEQMPGLNAKGKWVREPSGGPIGQSKSKNNGEGLSHYSGRCTTAGGRK